MEPQRSRTLNGRDLIKRTKKEKEEVKWRKTNREDRSRCHCCVDCWQLCRLVFSFFSTSGKLKKEPEKQIKMALTKLPGFSLVITLQSLLILGETFLAPETSKDSGDLKLTEKRTNNFRVPMEAPFDPNFWPARGRRSRRDPEKPGQNEDCITGENFSLQKARIQCQDLREENPFGRKLNFELMPGMELEEEVAGVGKTESDCYGNAMIPRLRDRPRGSLGFQIPDAFDGGSIDPKQFDETRHKKQKHSGQPQLILYGNGVYWEPENLFGEKKKKQDVFWVARGKKNFQNQI